MCINGEFRQNSIKQFSTRRQGRTNLKKIFQMKTKMAEFNNGWWEKNENKKRM